MALATAPNKRNFRKGHGRPWESPWDARARVNSGISLEDLASQFNINHNGHKDMAYVLVLQGIPANSNPIPNGMTAAEWKAHWKSVREFNEWYANKGIDQVVETAHSNIFEKALGKIYDAAHGLSYVAGKAVSLIPQPARRGLVPTSLAMASILTACQFDPLSPKADAPGIKEANYGNNTREVVLNATPTPKATPAPNNSYDFAKSLGLEAAYLKDIAFDSNSKALISYFASLPSQMKAIAERSGMLEDILADKRVDAKESVFFNKVIGSYQKEIEAFKPWLAQLPENEITAALALNLRNFREAGKGKNMFYTLDSNEMPLLLSPALFTADGIKRMYESEIKAGDKWGHGVMPYASTMVNNVTNFFEIQKKAWEVANSPNGKYGPRTIERSIEEILHAGYFQGEAVGSTDKGQNAYKDMKLLWEQGSPEAKAVLRVYARNMTREGLQGSAEQVRVELTNIDTWSIGIPTYEVLLAGHDVPTIPLTLDDIALLKSRSPDPLFILEIDGRYNLPLQWTRTSIVKKEWEQFSLYNGTKAIKLKVSELKNY